MSDTSVPDQRSGPAPGGPERRHCGLRDRERSLRSRVGVRHCRGRPDLSGSRPVRQRASPQRADRPGDPGVPRGNRSSTRRGLRRQATPGELSSAVDALTHVRLSSGGALSRYLAAVLRRGRLRRVTTRKRSPSGIAPPGSGKFPATPRPGPRILDGFLAVRTLHVRRDASQHAGSSPMDPYRTQADRPSRRAPSMNAGLLVVLLFVVALLMMAMKAGGP
jgi:hypothetical protein